MTQAPASDARAAPRGAPASSSASLDRDVWSMAWPALLSLVAVNVVDVIDVALVGRLGRESVAAWGYATQTVHLVETLLHSVGVATVALVARAVGAGEHDRERRVLAASALLALAVAVAGFSVTLAAPGAVLRSLGAEARVVELSTPYFRLHAGSMLLYAVAFVFESGLRARRNTRVPLLVAVAVMSVKTLLSVVLVFGLLGAPRLELLGAGIATVAAHGTGAVLYVVLSRRLARSGEACSFGASDSFGSRGVAAEVLRVSLPSLGERLVMSLALLTYFRILASYGTVAIAAYAIGVRLLAFSWAPGLGFATAAATLVGQSLGGADPARAWAAARRAIRQAVLVSCALGVGFAAGRGVLAATFTSDERVGEALGPFMLTLAVAQPFMGAHFTLGGVLRGAGDTVSPFVGAAVGNWLLRVPLAFLAASLGADLVWAWWPLVGDHLARTLVTYGAYRRGRWAERLGASIRAGAT